MPLTIKRRVSLSDLRKWWARIISGCEEQQINLMSDQSYWSAVREENESLARQGDVEAKRHLDDCVMFELYRPILDEKNKMLTGTWTNVRGEALIRTARRAQPGDVVAVRSMKGETRTYTLAEKVSDGIFRWKGR